MRKLGLRAISALIVAATLVGACGTEDVPTGPASEPTIGETAEPGDGSNPSTEVPVVRTETTGTHLDADGYSVTIDGLPGPAIGTTGSVSLSGLADGRHAVGLHGLAANCQVSVPNPQTLVVGDPFFDPIVIFYVYCD